MPDNTIPFDIALNQVRPIASQLEAEAGSNNIKAMSPLRVKQAIEKYLETYNSGWVFRGVWDSITDYVEGDLVRHLEILFLAKTAVPKNMEPPFPINLENIYWEYLIGANIKGSVKDGVLDIDGSTPIKYVEDEVFLNCRLLQDSELTLDLSEMPVNGVSKYLIINSYGYNLTFGTSYTIIKGTWDNRVGNYNIVELWYEEIEGVRVIIHNNLEGITGADGKSAYQIWLDEGNEGSEADFLLSLKGADGQPGIQGEQGETGAPGVQGPAGEAFYDNIILVPADAWVTRKDNGAIPYEEEDSNTGHTRWTKLFSPTTDQYICLEIRNLNNTLIHTNKFNLVLTAKCNEVDAEDKTVAFECRAYYKKSNQPSGNFWTSRISTKSLTNAYLDYRLNFNLVEFTDPGDFDNGCLVIELKRKINVQGNTPYDVFMVDTEIHLNK